MKETSARRRYDLWLGAGLAVIALFVALRFWRLGQPTDTVFDEVYFPVMAHQYLIHQNFFDIHPPLGKLIIAASELIFGNRAIGWRAASLLTGVAILPAAYWAVTQLFNDRRAGLIAAILIAIDGMFIVYARTGLMDGFMIFFGLLSLGFCWQFRHRRLAGHIAWGSLLATGLFAGLAVAIKWIGFGFLPIVALTTFVTLFFATKRPISFADFLIWLASFFLLPVVLYTVPFLANWQGDFWHQFFVWHQQSWDYNVNLVATHPYASKWWSWPFLIRPIWFYFKGIGNNIVGVDAIGNPIVWWGSTLAVVYTVLVLGYTALVWHRPASQIISKKELGPLLFLLFGWAAFYLPWSQIGRVLFLYHYFSSYLFALLLAAFWLSRSYAQRRNQVMILLTLAAAVVVGLAFVPIWTAYPIPMRWFNYLMWFKSWI